MKKYLFCMPIVAIVVMVSIFCSCGNASKQQEKEQNIKDSITKVIRDSLASIEAEKDYTKEQSKENVEKELKAILSDYINMNDNIEGCLSSDFNAVIKKIESTPNMGEWDLFGLNSSAMIQRFDIKNLTEAVDNKSKATVLLSIDDEGEYEEETCTIYLVFENGKWVVDEIDNVKKDMKSIIKNE